MEGTVAGMVPLAARIMQACQQWRQAAEVLPALESGRAQWQIRCCWHRVSGRRSCQNGSIGIFYSLKYLCSCFCAKREEKRTWCEKKDESGETSHTAQIVPNRIAMSLVLARGCSSIQWDVNR